MPTPLPTIHNVFRCALNWICGSQTAVNVIHIKAAVDGAGVADAMDALDATVSAAMWDVQVNAAHVDHVVITPLDGITASATFTPATPANWHGVGGADWTPAAANLVKLQTAFRGRNHRGRVFLPFPSETICTEGIVNSSDVATVQSGWDNFVTGLEALTVPTGSPWSLVVASYDRAHGGAGAAATAVEFPVAESALGTQRRRQSRLR